MGNSRTPNRKRTGKYHRARIRHFLFTVGPNKISGDRVRRRHLAQDIIVRELEIASPRWPAEFDGLRIGHVSDFHLGELLPLTKALKIVDQLGAQRPDLVACTGDVVDLNHDEAGPLLKALGGVDAPLGSLLVLGNHDELHCAETVTALAKQAGVIPLRNEVIDINRKGHHLRVAGIHWAKSALACAKHIDCTCAPGAGGFVHMLLAHNPKAFLRAADLDIPLTLAGHTHGGQIALRKRSHLNGNGSGVAGAGSGAGGPGGGGRFKIGLFECGPSRLYVTSGVGAWFPLRINCPPEIAMITMRHTAEDVVQRGRSRSRHSP